jgi:hypothetical protein
MLGVLPALFRGAVHEATTAARCAGSDRKKPGDGGVIGASRFRAGEPDVTAEGRPSQANDQGNSKRASW